MTDTDVTTNHQTVSAPLKSTGVTEYIRSFKHMSRNQAREKHPLQFPKFTEVLDYPLGFPKQQGLKPSLSP